MEIVCDFILISGGGGAEGATVGLVFGDTGPCINARCLLDFPWKINKPPTTIGPLWGKKYMKEFNPKESRIASNDFSRIENIPTHFGGILT